MQTASPNMKPNYSSDNGLLNETTHSIKKNVTFAVNYQLSMVDRFCMLSKQTRRRRKKSDVDSVLSGTQSIISASSCQGSQDTHRENSAPTLPGDPENSETRIDKTMTKACSHNISGNGAVEESRVDSCKSSNTESRTRRSNRDSKKRESKLERSRVKYDMELVPVARRHRSFLEKFPCWWLENEYSTSEAKQQQHQFGRRSSLTTKSSTRNDGMRRACLACKPDNDDRDSNLTRPFEKDESVIWIPRKRSEWEDSVSEMTSVCTSASLRRYIASNSNSCKAKPFHAPLSREYIMDRVDIDDPLCGFQIRHRTGGWLQGFILWTNFTTWTHYFKWDSLHIRSGLPAATRLTSEKDRHKLDGDGSLAAELEALPRSGDPREGGVVFPDVAEIALVGGLGCGEYLLRMALDSIRSKKHYKYVVLQATDSSKTFYEKFGFVRVGAICRYENPKQVITPGVDNTRPTIGYRHWTNPNESETSLEMHGGPSYMMCLKLPSVNVDSVGITDQCASCGRKLSEIEESGSRTRSFLEEMMTLSVDEKPTIEQLGGQSTPFPKIFKKRNSLVPATDSSTSRGPMLKITVNGRKRKYGRTPEFIQLRRMSSGSSSYDTANTSSSFQNEGLNPETKRRCSRRARQSTSTLPSKHREPAQLSISESDQSQTAKPDTPQAPKQLVVPVQELEQTPAPLPMPNQSLVQLSVHEQTPVLFSEPEPEPGSEPEPEPEPEPDQSPVLVRDPKQPPASGNDPEQSSALDQDPEQSPRDSGYLQTQPSKPGKTPKSESVFGEAIQVSDCSTSGVREDTDADSEEMATLDTEECDPSSFGDSLSSSDCEIYEAEVKKRKLKSTFSTLSSKKRKTQSDIIPFQKEGLISHIVGRDDVSNYVKKQYTSKWLAVAPIEQRKSVRRPPRNRSNVENVVPNFPSAAPKKNKRGRPRKYPERSGGTLVEEGTIKPLCSKPLPHDSIEGCNATTQLEKRNESGELAIQDEKPDKSCDIATDGEKERTIDVSAEQDIEHNQYDMVKRDKKKSATRIVARREQKPRKARNGDLVAVPPVEKPNSRRKSSKLLQQINVSTYTKQKMKSYPRDRAHFYNKVVRPKETGAKKLNTYSFVLHYDESTAMIRIVPMEIRGKLCGKQRKSRPRYMAALEETGSNIQTVPCADFEVVPAFMVMKTPFVAAEAWDILG